MNTKDRKEKEEIVLLTAKCLINLYFDLLNNEHKYSSSDIEKEYSHLKDAATNLLKDARENKIIIPRDERLLIYDIIRD